jgi:hypothetical protein
MANILLEPDLKEEELLLLTEEEVKNLVNDFKIEESIIRSMYESSLYFRPTLSWFQDVIELIIKHNWVVVPKEERIGDLFLVPPHTEEQYQMMDSLLHQEEILFDDLDLTNLELPPI